MQYRVLIRIKRKKEKRIERERGTWFEMRSGPEEGGEEKFCPIFSLLSRSRRRLSWVVSPGTPEVGVRDLRERSVKIDGGVNVLKEVQRAQNKCPFSEWPLATSIQYSDLENIIDNIYTLIFVFYSRQCFNCYQDKICLASHARRAHLF